MPLKKLIKSTRKGLTGPYPTTQIRIQRGAFDTQGGGDTRGIVE